MMKATDPGPRRLACAVLAAAWAGAPVSAALAQATQTLSPVVVTATRLPTELSAVGSSVTVIDAAEIERRQLRTMPEVLQAVPGLRTVQLGGPGAQSSVFARGTNSNHVLVLIDGLEATDPSSANGAFNFANLMVENVERIEVVRGPQSTLFGSDAIGAVINIITKRGEGPPRLFGRFEGGSYGTVNPAAGISGSSGRFNYSVDASYFHTDGHSFTADRVRPAGADEEADAYDNLTTSARLGLSHGETAETTLFTRYEHVKRETDDTAEDPDSGQEGDHYFIRLESKAQFFDDVWEPILALNHTRYRESFFNDPDPLSPTLRRTRQTGIKNKAELQNNIRIVEDHHLVFGMSAETDYLNQNTHTDFGGFVITGSSDENVDSRAVYLQDRFTLLDDLSGTVGVRRDVHQTFGGENTWRATLVWRVRQTDTRIKGSIGTGYRAPALFELFGTTGNNFGGAFVGNPDLQPEESKGWEAGFEQALFGDRASFGATYFRNDIDNLIVCDIATCANTQNARTYGVEAFVEAELLETLTARLDYTYTRAEDADIHSDLTRRPKHKGNLDLAWRPVAPAQITLGVAVIGRQKDVDFQTGGVTYTPGYALVSLSGSYEVKEDVELYARADNLLDRDYEVADGFAGRGLAVFAGVRARY